MSRVQEELDQAKANLANALKLVETQKGDISTLQTRAETAEQNATKLEKDNAEAVIAAEAQGRAAKAAELKARAEQMKDAAFVIETAELSDGEYKDKALAKLQKTTAAADVDNKAGEDVALSTLEEDDKTATGTPKTFEMAISRLVEDEKLTRGKATQAAAKRWPKLHDDYRERMYTKK